MVLDEHQPFLVQAVYSFKGKNNDEVSCVTVSLIMIKVTAMSN